MAALVAYNQCRCKRFNFVRIAVAAYHARARRWGFGTPIPEDPEIPWRTGPRFEARLYGRHGAVSGVRPEGLWPSPEALQQMQAEEQEWCPPLQEMQHRIRVREEQEEQERRQREKLIAANMAKMPQMVAEWRQQKYEMRIKEQEEKARRERLMAEAKERYGSAIDPRSDKFQEMVNAMEKEERKQAKLLKKKLRAESLAAAMATNPRVVDQPS